MVFNNQDGELEAGIRSSQVFWEGRTDQPVSVESAREMVENISQYFNILDEWMRRSGGAESQAQESAAGD